MNKVCAIIPARGGSKAIPKKNLSKINGRSLLEIGITTCMNANIINEVFVSTDDAEIAIEARRFNANVINRPSDISNDIASSEDAILHALSNIEQPNTILFYQITNPFTSPEDIDNAYNYFIKHNADSLFTASPFTHFIWKREGKNIIPVNHDYSKRKMRQEIYNYFIENGAFYIMDTMGFVKNKCRFFGKIEMYEMSSLSAHEIDEVHDLKIAEVLYNEPK